MKMDEKGKKKLATILLSMRGAIVSDSTLTHSLISESA